MANLHSALTVILDLRLDAKVTRRDRGRDIPSVEIVLDRRRRVGVQGVHIGGASTCREMLC